MDNTLQEMIRLNTAHLNHEMGQMSQMDQMGRMCMPYRGGDQSKSFFFYLLSEIRDKLNIFDKVHSLSSTLKESVESVVMSLDLAKILNIINTESSLPELKSYVLIRCLELKLQLYAATILNTYNFDMGDDYVIVESLLKSDFTMIEFLVDKGFCYVTHELNPFLIIIKMLSISNTIIRIGSVTDLEQEAIKIFDLFIKAGYDIHMQNGLAFKHCMNITLLKYFIKIGTDVPMWGVDWMRNFHNQFNINGPELLKLIINNGLDIALTSFVLSLYAFIHIDIDILRILDEHNVNFKEHEKLLIPQLGQCVIGQETDDLEFFKILNKNGCDLSLVSPIYLNYLVRQHRYKAVAFLFEHGIDISQILCSDSKSIDNDGVANSKYKTFQILTKCGLPIQKIIQMI